MSTAVVTPSVTLPPIPYIKTTREVEFETYHRKHPEIYRTLVELARQAKHMGHGRYSMKSLYEVARWHRLTKRDTPFKLNNDYTSRYARMIMEREKDLRGMFETRTLLHN